VERLEATLHVVVADHVMRAADHATRATGA